MAVIPIECLAADSRGGDVDRALSIARTAGLWIFGLMASGSFGYLLGALIHHGYDNQGDTGMLAGVSTFACVRLWISDVRMHRKTLRAHDEL